MKAPADDGGDLRLVVAELTRERDAALGREAALAEVLALINRSPDDPEPVFGLILEKAHTLCGAAIGALSIYDGTLMHTLAMRGFPDDYAARMREPWPPPEVTTRRLIDGADVVQIPDAAVIGHGFGFMTGRSDMRTTLVVPLRKDNAFLGQITAFRAEVRPFSEEQIALLRGFAAQAVIALENARLVGVLRQRTDQLARRNTEYSERIDHQAATIDVLKAMSASPGDPRPVFDLIAVRARDVCGAYGVTVYEFDGTLIHRHAATGVSDDPTERDAAKADYPLPPARDRFAGRAILDRAIVHIRDHRTEPGLLWLPHFNTAKSSVTVPVMRDGVPIGALSMGSRETGGFTDTQVELLKTFAEQAAIAITSAETFRALQHRTADLQESLEYQTATSDVLKAISRSTFELQPVLDTLITTAARLCEAENAFLLDREGDTLRAKAIFQMSPDQAAILQSLTLKMDRGTISGRVALEGRVVQIADVTTDPDYSLSETVSVARNRTLLGVPLLRQGVVVGVFALGRQHVQPFTDQQIALISTFADQAVIAIENTRLLTEQREALERQTATSELLQVINASPGHLQPVFDTMLEKAHGLCDAPLGALVIWDGARMRAVATHGFPDQYAARLRQPFAPSRASQSLLDGARLYHIPDARTDAPDPRAHGVQATGARTALLIPLRKDGAFLGYISSFRKEVRPFSDKEIALLENFAAQAVIAMENARLLGELRERTAELADRNAAFAERIDHQAATIDVLKEMSNSPGDAQPVFDLICDQARTLLGTPAVTLFEYDGTMVHLRARSLDASFADPAAIMAYGAGWPRIPDRGSLSCRAILDRTVIHVRDMDAEPGVSPEVRALGSKTQVVIPLVREGRAIGAISTGSTRRDGVSDTQIELLKTFAEQAVIAIQSAETWRALQERTAALAQRNSEFGERIEQQAATIDVLKVMSSTPDDTQPVFDQIVRRAQELCNAPSAALFQFDGELVHYRARALPLGVDVTSEFATYQKQFPMVPDSGSLTCRAILEKRVIHARNTEIESGLSPVVRDVLRRSGFRSQLTVPLLRDDVALGAITLNALNTGGFTDSQVALLQTFAEQAVIAIGSVATFRALRERTDELARRQNELSVTFENMGDGVAMFDETQRLVAWNRRFQDLIDVPDDVISQRRTFSDYIRFLAERGEYGPDADPEEQIGRLTETIGQHRVYERTRPNGTVIEIRNNPVASGGFVVIYADITERKRAETAIRAARDAAETALRDLQTAQDRLIQAEKMASLGQLTAGIAHEIKNPLNFVNNFASLSVELLDELNETAAPAFATLAGDARIDVEDLTETLTGNLKKIEEHGKRADGIVRSMLEHSRGSSSERRAVDINDLVDEALNLAFHGARARDQSFNITLERDFSTAIAPIEVNPQDLTRVFLNLFSNGFYAANKRAKDDAANGFAPVLRASTRDLGHGVEIRVRDNGTGIPDEIRDKLFQPFFTTKPTGEGTGLGLSITYDIVTKQHRGTIAVESRVGSFTEFIVMIPREPRLGGGAP